MTNKRILNNEDGQAMIESIPLIAIFILLMMYSLGLFGVIHSGILFSIGSRAYAFETFRNRANTDIFRYSANSRPNGIFSHRDVGFRYHYVTDDAFAQSSSSNDPTSATARRIVYGINREPVGETNENLHNENAFVEIRKGERNRTVGVSPAWLMVGYGLCMDAECGAEDEQ